MSLNQQNCLQQVLRAKTIVVTTILLNVFTGFFSDAFAEHKAIEKDLNGDGKIDQIAYYDSKDKLHHIAYDRNNDGIMERFQYYENDTVTRIERDTDLNGGIDQIDNIKNGFAFQRNKINTDGQVYEIQIFAESGKILVLKESTGENNIFDKLTYYVNELPSYSTHDINADGHIDIWTYYSEHNPGEIIRQEKDRNKDSKIDEITNFKNSLPENRQKDTNFDGRFNTLCLFDSIGNLKEIQEDNLHSGKPSRILYFENSLPVKVITDSDEDGFLETTTLLENGKCRLQTSDKNKDGKADVSVYYNETEQVCRSEVDSNFDGLIDTWQYYKNGRMDRLEQDKNCDNIIDIKADYKDGKKVKMYMDSDYDRFFETLELCHTPEWDRVLSQDFNRDNHFEINYYFKQNTLKLKSVDENNDHHADLRYYYSENGKVLKSESLNSSGQAILVWHYDEKENPVSAEQDNNNDGTIDTWYEYNCGKLIALKEDTNNDGKADIWETYDQKETLVKREKDLNYDGTPDLTETNFI